jgi:uncharacterized membrane protein YphA (DoxX/SURF4 family)
MDYYVKRDGEQYGPYSLAELQRYLAQGNIQPTDLARSEGLEEWIEVRQIVGNIVVQQPPPPAVNYGQAPVCPQPFAGAASYATVQGGAGPMPPGLHWALVLLFSIATCYLFALVWMFVEAGYAQKLRTSSKPMLFYGIGIPSAFLAGALSGFPEMKPLAAILQLGGGVLMIAGHFSLKNALEEHFNSVEPMNLQLSGPLVFFFNVFYIQYHLSDIRKWKQSGGAAYGRGMSNLG